jgi:hypothetical protein
VYIGPSRRPAEASVPGSDQRGHDSSVYQRACRYVIDTVVTRLVRSGYTTQRTGQLLLSSVHQSAGCYEIVRENTFYIYRERERETEISFIDNHKVREHTHTHTL